MVNDRERMLWRRYNALLTTVPGMLDERMRAATGLSRFHFTLLETLQSRPDRQLLLSDVARAADSSLSRLSHAMARLEEAGLVERRPCDTDRRASWAVLTAAGEQVVNDGRAAFDSLVHEVLLDRIPEERRGDAIELLNSLLSADVAAACAAVEDATTPIGAPLTL